MFLQTGGVQLYYEMAGRGPAVLFAHESTGDCSNWLAQVQRFARRYTCIAYNARGYPPSDAPRDPQAYSQDVFVADMLAVLDHLNVAAAHIVGLSMGSMTTLHFGLKHRERALSLVLAGTGPGESREAKEGFNHEVRSLAESLESSGWGAFVEQYNSTPDRTNLRWKNPPMFEHYIDRLRRRDGKVSAIILREVVCRRPLLCEIDQELRGLELPVLIVTGDEDRECLPTSLFLKRALPRAGLVVFPQTGHAVNLEEPELFGDALQRFYDAIDRGSWQ